MSTCLNEGQQRQVDWLLDGPIRLEDGMLAAWADGLTPAHAYQESTGYLISLLCFLHELTGDPRYEAEAGRTVLAMVAAVRERAGCGRGGAIYLFDTAVCLRGLARFVGAFPAADAAGPARTLARRLQETACSLAGGRLALDPAPQGEESGRWSALFGAHQIKALSLISPRPGAWRGLRDELLASWYGGGKFNPQPGMDRVYTHAHCYAVEGLLSLPDTPGEVVRAAVAFLADVQETSGAIPSWSPAREGDTAATDATAQAVRLWLLADPGGFQDNIHRGLSFLEQMIGPGGGVRYSPCRSHENAWATIFAVQASIWQGAAPPDPGWLI